MSKILELNGFKYSREKFEEHKFRAIFKFSVSEDWREDSNINIYTDNPDKKEVEKVINSKKTEKVTSCVLFHWTTKEQDELTTQFIEEPLKDL